MNENEIKKNGGEVEIDLLRILGIIWHNIIIIAVVTLTVALIAMVFAKFIVSPTYKSSAMLYVNNKNSGTTSEYISTTEISAAKSLVSTYAVILKSNSTLSKVIAEAGLGDEYTPVKLAKKVSASAVDSTEIFRITVTANDPDEAKIIVEKITEILPDAIAGVVEGARVTVVDPATEPVKSGPSTVKYVLIGALLGFFLMSGLLIVFDLADDKIHEERYLAENYSYPVLAVIPNIYVKYEGGSHYEKQ